MSYILNQYLFNPGDRVTLRRTYDSIYELNFIIVSIDFNSYSNDNILFRKCQLYTLVDSIKDIIKFDLILDSIFRTINIESENYKLPTIKLPTILIASHSWTDKLIPPPEYYLVRNGIKLQFDDYVIKIN